MRRTFPTLDLACLFRVVCVGVLGLVSSYPLPALDPHTPLARYTRQAWSTETGLPQDSIHAMLQTSDGFLWLATEGGLARFDGYQFRIFDRESTPRLPDNDVRCVLEDHSGALWIGTATGLSRLKGDSIQTFTVADGLPSEAIRSMLEAPDGTLWIVTAGGIATARANTADPAKVNFQALGGLGSANIYALAPDSQGGIWAATSDGLSHIAGGRVGPGLPHLTAGAIEALAIVPVPATPGSLLVAAPEGIERVVGGVLTIVAKEELLPPGGIHALLATPEGVWAAGKNSLALIKPDGILSFAAGRDLPGTQITTLVRDRQGALWIGTNAGLARWWRGRLERFAPGQGSTAAAVLCLYEDRDGDLWIGTESGGAYVLREPTFEILGRPQGLAEGPATSVVQAADGSLWVGTGGGGLNRIALEDAAAGTLRPTRTYTSKDGLASDTVLALASIPPDARGPAQVPDLWVGTPDGLNLLHGGRWTVYTSADGLADDLIRSLLVARDGAVWAGTRRGVTRWQNGQGTTWTRADGLGSDLVGALLEDVSGDIWLGTLGGLTRMHGGFLKTYTTADGLPSNTITALEAAPNGALWIGSNGQGLARWDGTRFFSFTASSLPREIYAIVDDAAGALWLSSDHGIYRVAVAELDEFRAGKRTDLPVVHFGTADGLPSLEGASAGHPSAVRLTDGRICFATRRGVVLLDPGRLPQKMTAPPVVIEQILVDDRNVTASELASIAAGPSHFSFSFAGIHLAAPQRVQYRYKLEGFDRDWIDAGVRRTAFYTSLPHGRYRFRVSARMPGGPWSEPDAAVEVALELRPHFYQTFWFYLLLTLVLAAVLFALYRLRVRTLQDRFDAVAAERGRIAREIHDTLAQGFVAVSVRLEVISQMLRSGKVDACRDQLDQTRGLVRDSLAEARRSIWDLRSEDARTLPAMLARSLQEAVAGGVDAQLETTGVYRPLAPSIEDHLLRIAGEAVANSLRHARAKKIRLRLAYAVDRALLEVADDGLGFDPAEAPSREQGHFGLTGMRERAREIGAAVMLESTPGRGTTVRLDVPLPPAQGSKGPNAQRMSSPRADQRSRERDGPE